MYKILKRLAVCAVFSVLLWGIFLLADRAQLSTGVIRFHVVANSDSSEDQQIKLSVRDAVLDSLQHDLQNISNVELAKAYLQENVPKIQRIANQTLEELGFEGNAFVSLCRETFDVRHYDTFSLPAGVYDSLRIIIGEGSGKNWWCVSYPALCVPATAQDFETAAVGAGFSEPLAQALTEPCELRFFFLDQLGKLENIFFQE